MENNIVTKKYDAKEMKSAKLRKATENINKIGMEFRKNYFKVASIIARVDTDKAYEDDGFKSVHEWTEKCFGIRRSVSYSLLRIGKEETLEVFDDKGRVIDYTSRLCDVNGNGFSVTQLERIFSLDDDVKSGFIKDGVITADMTCKEIMDVVKKYKDSASFDQLDDMPKAEQETFKVIIKGSRSKQQVLVEGLNEKESYAVQIKIAEMFGGVVNDEKEDN